MVNYCPSFSIISRNTNSWVKDKFIRASSPLHMEQVSLKRDHSTEKKTADLTKHRKSNPSSDLPRLITSPEIKPKHMMEEKQPSDLSTHSPAPIPLIMKPQATST